MFLFSKYYMRLRLLNPLVTRFFLATRYLPGMIAVGMALFPASRLFVQNMLAKNQKGTPYCLPKTAFPAVGVG